MVDVNCNICNSSEKKHLFATRDYNWSGDRPFNIVKCKNCGLIYLTPRPVEKELSKYYPDIYYGRKGTSPRHKVRVLGKRFRPGRILDVGCGKGFFLNRMRRLGWMVQGIELSAEEANYAKENFNIEVYTKNIKELSLPANYFDLITFWHVLEHMEDVLIVLKQVHKFLKTGGHLFISTPNISSLQAHLFGEKWYHIDAPRHLNLFSVKTLKLLLEKSGFSMQEVNYFAFDHNLFGWIMSLLNLFNLNQSRLLSRFLMRPLCLLMLPVAFIEGLFPFGGTIEVLAIKDIL